MRKLVLVALLAIACGASTVSAQALALTYKSGDTYKYKLHSTANEMIDAGVMTLPVKLDLKADETVTVKSVDSSGTAGLSIDLSNVVMSSVTGPDSTATATPGMTMPAISMTIAADGRILSVNGNSFGGNPFTQFTGGGAFISAVLPDRPVKPKDTWSKDFDQANPMGTGSTHVTSTSTYLRDESLKGINAAVVETKTSGTIDLTIDLAKMMAGDPSSATAGIPIGLLQSLSVKGTVTSTVMSWIDPSGHRIMKSHKAGTINAKMTFTGATGQAMPGLTGPISIKGDETTDLSPA
jgi:hypothetical protein